MLEIIYHVNSKTGVASVRDCIEKIQKTSIQAKIKANIHYVAEKDGLAGNFVTKNIRGYDLSEIKIKIYKNLYRIIYCVWKNNYLVLLHAFSKKEGNPTSDKELKIAQDKYLDFKNNQKLYI